MRYVGAGRFVNLRWSRKSGDTRGSRPGDAPKLQAYMEQWLARACILESLLELRDTALIRVMDSPGLERSLDDASERTRG